MTNLLLDALVSYVNAPKVYSQDEFDNLRVKTLINKKPIVVLNSANLSQMNQIIQRKKIHHLPIVDKNKKLVGLYIEELPGRFPKIYNSTMLIYNCFLRTIKQIFDNKPEPKNLLSIYKTRKDPLVYSTR